MVVNDTLRPAVWLETRSRGSGGPKVDVRNRVRNALARGALTLTRGAIGWLGLGLGWWSERYLGVSRGMILQNNDAHMRIVCHDLLHAGIVRLAET